MKDAHAMLVMLKARARVPVGQFGKLASCQSWQCTGRLSFCSFNTFRSTPWAVHCTSHLHAQSTLTWVLSEEEEAAH